MISDRNVFSLSLSTTRLPSAFAAKYFCVEGLRTVQSVISSTVVIPSFTSLDDFEKYTASIDEYELIFVKNKISSRWWIKIPSETENNNFNENTLLPCTFEDFELAQSGNIPERWFKALKKNIL